ncbi:MAG: hypothetical protein ACHBN1_34985 [Heteroscytonema crispum UTEX LB 1556]
MNEKFTHSRIHAFKNKAKNFLHPPCPRQSQAVGKPDCSAGDHTRLPLPQVVPPSPPLPLSLANFLLKPAFLDYCHGTTDC